MAYFPRARLGRTPLGTAHGLLAGGGPARGTVLAEMPRRPAGVAEAQNFICTRCARPFLSPASTRYVEHGGEMQQSRAVLGIGPRTSRTRSEHHATRPSSLVIEIHRCRLSGFAGERAMEAPRQNVTGRLPVAHYRSSQRLLFRGGARALAQAAAVLGHRRRVRYVMGCRGLLWRCIGTRPGGRRHATKICFVLARRARCAHTRACAFMGERAHARLQPCANSLTRAPWRGHTRMRPKDRMSCLNLRWGGRGSMRAGLGAAEPNRTRQNVIKQGQAEQNRTRRNTTRRSRTEQNMTNRTAQDKAQQDRTTQDTQHKAEQDLT